MKIYCKKILLISPEPWSHIFVSKHHYATHLAKKGNEVFFLNPPSKHELVENTDFDNISSVHYKGFIKALRFFPTTIQKKLIQKKFNELEKLCQTTFEVVWSFDNSVFFDFSALPKSVYCISHIVDWNQNFQFKKASLTANLCLSTSNYLLEKQKKYNQISYNIGHGFNEVKSNYKKFILKGSNKINCGYAGNLDIPYLDWELVEKLVSKNTNIGFHFVGSWKSIASYPKITAMSNFYFYGKLNANELPNFYSEMDLLVLFYQYEKYPQQLANPHKMMEYLASGKSILATWTEEYQQIADDGIIKMAKNSNEFLSFFNEMIIDLGAWNSKEKVSFRKEITSSKTYSKQIERIEKLLNG